MKDATDPWKALTALLLIPFVMALNGWAVVLMWRWFVVPLGVHAITFWWAFGLVAFVNIFRRTPPSDDSDLDELIGKTFVSMIGTVIVVGLCYFVHFQVQP